MMRLAIRGLALLLVALFYLVTILVFLVQETETVLTGALESLRAGVDWCDRRAARLRRRAALRAVVAALLFVAIVPALALAQPAAPSTVVNISPLLQWVLGIAGAIVSALIPLGVAWVGQHLSLAKNAQAQAALQSALLAAAQFGLNKVQQTLKDQPVTVDMHNQVLAAAAGYVTSTVPDAIARLGLSDQQIADALLARLDLTGGTVTVTQTPSVTVAPAAAK